MSIQEAILRQRKNIGLSHKIINRLNLKRQKILRFATYESPKVFYPYHNLLHTHPFFLRYYKQPPLQYSNQYNAELCHWVSSLPGKRRTGLPYVIEPQDHPLSPAGKSEPGEVVISLQRVLSTYLDPKCRNILVESEGQLNLFKRYLPNEVLEKTEIVRLGAIPQFIEFDQKSKNIQTPIFLCLASDYKNKAVDLLIQAWLEFSFRTKCQLILACPNIPYKMSDSLSKENIRIIRKAPLSESEKHELLKLAHVMVAPLHVDGGGNIIEALEYGLPVITMRSQRSYIRGGNGWEVDVPFYFYDKGYGKEWPTWAHFWELLDDAKQNHAFDDTVQGFVNIFEKIASSPEKLIEMGKSSHKLACGDFSLETRNRVLRRIYTESLQ